MYKLQIEELLQNNSKIKCPFWHFTEETCIRIWIPTEKKYWSRIRMNKWGSETLGMGWNWGKWGWMCCTEAQLIRALSNQLGSPFPYHTRLNVEVKVADPYSLYTDTVSSISKKFRIGILWSRKSSLIFVNYKLFWKKGEKGHCWGWLRTLFSKLGSNFNTHMKHGSFRIWIWIWIRNPGRGPHWMNPAS